MERSFKTLKSSWLNGFDPSSVNSLEELNVLLDNYVHTRNTTVNRSISTSPMERYIDGAEHVRRPESQEWLNECFMNRITRRVNLDSTISIDTVLYDVPMQFIKSIVEVRYLPDRMEDAYIFFEGKRHPIRKTDRVENGRTKRKNSKAIDYSRLGE